MLSVYFNASPLLLPKTGIRQYAAWLLSEIRASAELDPHYFYLGTWSKELRLEFQEQGGSRLWRLKNVIRDKFPFSLEIQPRLRERMFNRGIRGADRGIYHELNFVPFATDLPTVVTIHDLSVTRFPEMHPAARVAFMEGRVAKAATDAAMILTDSEYVRKEVMEEYSIPGNKVVAIPLAASHNFMPQVDGVVAKTLSTYSLQDKKYFLAVGTLEPRKNLITAIQAHAALPGRVRKEYPLVLAGLRGWENSTLDKVLYPLAQSGDVRVLGYVPDEHLPAMYSGATAFVYPSLYEGFGLPPLEAMACGAPVIASNRASLPEVVGDAGITIDAYDIEGLCEAMHELACDPKKRQKLAESGLQQSRHFSWRRTAAETIDVYKAIQQAIG